MTRVLRNARLPRIICDFRGVANDPANDQMTFRILAIQKKVSEVWKLLATTKVESEKFGSLIAEVEKQIGIVQSILN